jgi:hypothetical protein
MIRLELSLRAWGTPDFEAALKQEVARLGIDRLPLQQGLSGSAYVVDAPVTVVVLGVAETEDAIRVKAGIFYKGVIAGCSCADDPTPIGENDEYCEVRLDIDKSSAAATVALVE